MVIVKNSSTGQYLTFLSVVNKHGLEIYLKSVRWTRTRFCAVGFNSIPEALDVLTKAGLKLSDFKFETLTQHKVA